MKNLNRRILCLICSILIVFSNFSNCIAEFYAEEDAAYAEDVLEEDISSEELEVNVQEQEILDDSNVGLELASSVRTIEGEVYLAKIEDENVWFYNDQDLTEKVFPAWKDVSYIIVDEIKEKEVLCVEALDDEQHIVYVYVAKKHALIWKETDENTYIHEEEKEIYDASEDIEIPSIEINDTAADTDAAFSADIDMEVELTAENHWENAEDEIKETNEAEISSDTDLEEEIAIQAVMSAEERTGMSGNGSLYLVAQTANELLIPPMTVYYGAGDTLNTLVQRINGHSVIVEKDGTISNVDRVEADYHTCTEAGTVTLSVSADANQYLVISEKEIFISPEMQMLIASMAGYLESGAAADNQDAAEIYRQVLERYLNLSDEEAAEWAERLNAAMQQEDMETGDEQEPENMDGVYQIKNGGELKWFADLVNGELEGHEQAPQANAVLINDISISEYLWSPIGSKEVPFEGVFDGQNHVISGLYIQSQEQYQALFGYAGAEASIKNLTVSGYVETSADYAAGIVAGSEANLDNLHNNSTVVSSGSYIAGVAAWLDQQVTVSSCTNSGSIYSSNTLNGCIGGVGGYNGTYENCRNTGSIHGYRIVGGICGQANIVTDCRNDGNVFVVSSNAGGIAGSIIHAASGCENYGTISVAGVYSTVNFWYAGSGIGGIAGGSAALGSYVTDSYNYGSIIATAGSEAYIQDLGGILGKVSNGYVSDCQNFGAIYTGGRNIGGILGSGFYSDTFAKGYALRCVNHGDVAAVSENTSIVGGIVGNGNAVQCYNEGSIQGVSAVGGIVGGGRQTGGKTDSANQAVIESCYNLGTVSGHTQVGGIAGLCKNASNCFDVGEVSCDDSIAGLIAGGHVSIDNCYYLATLSLYSKAGIALEYADMRTCMLGTDHFVLNFSKDYHAGYPYLDFEGDYGSAHVDSIELVDDDETDYFTVLGKEPQNLPKKVKARAGGLQFLSDVLWVPEDAYDINIEGTYTFVPQLVLPTQCFVSEETEIVSITVTVGNEEKQPVVSAIRFENKLEDTYITAYGKEPSELPDTAFVVIDDREKKVAVTWKPEEGYDLTNTEVPILYTMQFVDSYKIAEDVEVPQIHVRVLPEMLIEEFHFTQLSVDAGDTYMVTYRNNYMEDEVQHFEYVIDVFDTSGYRTGSAGVFSDNLYLWAKPNEEMSADTTISYQYQTLAEESKLKKGNVIAGKGIQLQEFNSRTAEYIGENDLLLTATATDGETEVIQKYHIHSRVHPTIDVMELTGNGTPLLITPSYDGKWMDYFTLIPASVNEVEFHMTPAITADQVRIWVDGEEVTAGADGSFAAAVSMGFEEKTVLITISYTQSDGSVASTSYTIKLNRPEETLLSVNLSPEDTLLRISNTKIGNVCANTDGTYTLFRGYTYDYLAVLNGYVTQCGTITASEDTQSLDIVMEPVPDNPAIIEEMGSEWDSFRGDGSNNAVADVLTPTNYKEALLYWAEQTGAGYSSEAISSPILADGYLICTSKRNIFKLDTVTGQIVAVGDMVTASTFNITPPTYANGMIFVALAGGIVQAFNADTLESLWVYTDSIGGQPNSPITYKDGFIYTGFWCSETSNGNMVCLSITDEKPSSTLEAKKALWTYTQKGGFYWAGAYAGDGFVLVGTDDGENGYTSNTANLLSLNARTGEIIDCLNDVKADVRSTICYDAQTNRFYFTTKGGYFYSVAVDADGRIDHDSVKIMDLRDGRVGDDGVTPVQGMSTSTPVVYNGRAYIGVSGVGQFNAYDGHCIAVIDLKDWKVAYTCPTKGYPQTSGLLTNGYEKDGKVYLYFFENASPGTLRVICDSPGQTEMLSVMDGKPITKAEDLFSPRGAQRQFVLCSPIVDEYGTLYFKNDSGYMMALGSTIEKIEVTNLPDKVMYQDGEFFDADGMKVTATYGNGLTRDITKYVTYSEEPLTSKDTDITLYFEHVKYNNAAEVVDPPHTVVNLTVLSTRDMDSLTSVIDAINELGEITLNSVDDIKAARRKYDNLKDKLKDYVDNYDVLTAAEETYQLLESAEKTKASKVIRLIDAIGEVTLDSGATIQAATEGYEALSIYGKVRVTNYATLKAAQQAYEALVRAQDNEAAKVMQQIADLGEVTLESGAELIAVRSAYEKLSQNSKAKVTNYAVLTAAEERYQELVQETQDKAERVSSYINAIGTVTLDKEDVIRKAREEYDKLDAASRTKIENYNVLVSAEAELAALKEQMKELEKVTSELNGYVARIRAVAPDKEKVTTENAAAIAGEITKIENLISKQSKADQKLLDNYLTLTDQYRSAIEYAVHTDTVTGLTVDGLEWNYRVVVETLTSADDVYKLLEKGISPKKPIKAYRVSVVDLLTGKAVSDHEKLNMEYEILVPSYNESAYSTIGVVAMAKDGTVRNISSTYTDNHRKMAFAVIGDGVIAVAGTKADMQAGDSHEGSDSVLDDPTETEAGTGESEQKPSGNGNSATPHSGSAGSSGSVLPGSSASGNSGTGSAGGIVGSGSLSGSGRSSTYYSNSGAVYSSEKQAEVNEYYGTAIESGKWEYREVVIPPVWLGKMSDEQVTLYQNLSKAVEKGQSDFVSDPVDQDAFRTVLECYRKINPLEKLVTSVEWTEGEEEGNGKISYELGPEEHKKILDEWHAQVEMIVLHCLETGKVTETAANLYKYMTTNFVPYTEKKKDPSKEQETEVETESETETDSENEETEELTETEAVLDLLYEKFAPSPFYAVMKNQVAANEAAVVYEYLLMQAGIESMPVHIDLTAPKTDQETESETEPQSEPETEGESETESVSESKETNKRYHQWVMVYLDDNWYHADAELDIAVVARKGTEADALGHFGMNEEDCKKAFQSQNEFEVIVPTGWDSPEVPESKVKLGEYGMSQTVVVKKEDNTDEE